MDEPTTTQDPTVVPATDVPAEPAAPAGDAPVVPPTAPTGQWTPPAETPAVPPAGDVPVVPPVSTDEPVAA